METTKDFRKFQAIPLTELVEAPDNPRKHFDKAALAELTSSIKTHGVLTPLLVRQITGGKYVIAAGHRRFRASKAAGLVTVPAIVRDFSDEDFLEILQIENLQREDVHPMEEAHGFMSLMKDGGKSAKEIAARLSRSLQYVYDRLRLLDLVPEARALFREGKITTAHAILLSRLDGPDQKRAIKEGGNALFTVERVPRLPGVDSDDRTKPVSVREFQVWIDDHVRFRPEKHADPQLFEATAATLAKAKETAEKVVPITRDFMIPDDAKDGKERVYTIRSWRRADGKVEPQWYGRAKKGATCDVSVLGVVVVGHGRGETFRVCIDRTCKIHWAAEIKEKAARAKGKSRQSEGEAEESREKRYKAEQVKRDAERAQWAKAAPEIAKRFAKNIVAAKGIGHIASLVLHQCGADAGSRIPKVAAELAPKGNTADAVLRRAAYLIVADVVFDDWSASREVPKLARAFGVRDLAKIIKDANTPEKEKEA